MPSEPLSRGFEINHHRLAPLRLTGLRVAGLRRWPVRYRFPILSTDPWPSSSHREIRVFGDTRQGVRRRTGDAETKPLQLIPDRTELVTRVFVQACPFSVIAQAASADTPHEATTGVKLTWGETAENKRPLAAMPP